MITVITKRDIQDALSKYRSRNKYPKQNKVRINNKKKIRNALTKRYPRKKTYVHIFEKFWGDVKECQKCWGTKGGLQIHHINKNAKDNHPFNLIKICLVCHCKEHKGDQVYKIMKKRLDFILKK